MLWRPSPRHPPPKKTSSAKFSKRKSRLDLFAKVGCWCGWLSFPPPGVPEAAAQWRCAPQVPKLLGHREIPHVLLVGEDYAHYRKGRNIL